MVRFVTFTAVTVIIFTTLYVHSNAKCGQSCITAIIRSKGTTVESLKSSLYIAYLNYDLLKLG